MPGRKWQKILTLLSVSLKTVKRQLKNSTRALAVAWHNGNHILQRREDSWFESRPNVKFSGKKFNARVFIKNRKA
jgi:hypothetical protein